MREEKLYLTDIKGAIDKICRYTEGLTYEDLEKNEKTIDAVLRNFEIIGEAARNISEKTKEGSVDLPWRAIISMRNMLTHEYFGADLAEVWKTIKEDLPALKDAVERMIQNL